MDQDLTLRVTHANGLVSATCDELVGFYVSADRLVDLFLQIPGALKAYFEASAETES